MGRYKWDKTNHVLIPISNETSNFTGTAAEWNALVAAEKAKYKTVDLTDDFNGVEVIDNLSRTTYSGEPLSARMGNSLGKMVANIESTSTASQLYKVNDQFVYNGILYKVTSQIASGGAITPGSNCTPAPSVTSQISNLSSSFTKTTIYKLTNTYGSANLELPYGDGGYEIVFARTGDNMLIIPFTYGNYWYVNIRNVGDNSPVSNTNVAIVIGYVKSNIFNII